METACRERQLPSPEADGPFSKADPMDYRDAFEIETTRPAAKVVILAVRGEIDICASHELMEAIIGAFGEHPEMIAVDLSELQYMDSVGLRVLVEGGRHIEGVGVRFGVILPPEHRLARLPQLIGLHRRLNVHESREVALRQWLDPESELAES
jgi:anti-sigma B factor antagonist